MVACLSVIVLLPDLLDQRLLKHYLLDARRFNPIFLLGGLLVQFELLLFLGAPTGHRPRQLFLPLVLVFYKLFHQELVVRITLVLLETVVVQVAVVVVQVAVVVVLVAVVVVLVEAVLGLLLPL